MNYSYPDARSNLRLLCTAACRERSAQITAFENAHFGPGFSWAVEHNEAWMVSGAAFQAAIFRDTPETIVTASISAVIATSDSCERLLNGHIQESELCPWVPSTPSQLPVIYFSSVIASDPGEVPLLYRSLAADVEGFLNRAEILPTQGLAIAYGDAGRGHLIRNGFVGVNARYLGGYEFMTITARQARTPFWRKVLADMPSTPLVHDSEYSLSSFPFQ